MTITEKLTDKRILLLSVQTFNYEKEIAAQLRKFGAEVDFYDERPANSNFAKGIIRLKKSLYQKTIDDYYKRILREVADKNYDYLFVIRGEVVPAFFLEEFKKLHPNCFLLFYTWDSFANHQHPLTILSYFDECYTFDPMDAEKYNLFLRPLFYLDEYGALVKQKVKNEIDVLFLGTAHSDRYKISNKVVNWCNSNGFSTHTYYYMHGRFVFLYKKYFDATFHDFDFKKLNFKSLSKTEILKLFSQSSVILDINHPGQKGLTMRTFEALGAGKKVITTNGEVKKYPFYNENNILVIDRENPLLNDTFFNSPTKPIEHILMQKMSISGWVESLFLEKDSGYWIEGYK
jgi:hypothetical protein